MVYNNSQSVYNITQCGVFLNSLERFIYDWDLYLYMKKVKTIIKIPHSVAFTDGCGYIYVNKHLEKYNSMLFRRILEHELSHADGSYNKHDFILDLHSGISQWELLKFCLRHPSGFIQYSPIVKVGDKLLFSWLSLLKILITIGVVWVVITLVG